MVVARFSGRSLVARRALDRLRSLRQSGHPLISDAVHQSGVIYLNDMRRRYVAAARGDGTWPDLAYSTKLARIRKRKTQKKRFESKVKKELKRGKSKKVAMQSTIEGMKFSILMDSANLFNSLSEGSAGNILDVKPFYVTAGTAVYYAKHHQKPKVPGRPPERKILVPPSDGAKARIKGLLSRATQTVLQEATGGSH